MSYIEGIEEPEWNSYMDVLSTLDQRYVVLWMGTHLFSLKKWFCINVKHRVNHGWYPFVTQYQNDTVLLFFTSLNLAVNAIQTRVNKKEWEEAALIPYDILAAGEHIKKISKLGDGLVTSVIFNPYCNPGGWGLPINQVESFIQINYYSNPVIQKPIINPLIQELAPKVRPGESGCKEETLRLFWSTVFSLDQWYIASSYDPENTYGPPGFMGTPTGEYGLPVFTDIEASWSDCDKRLREEKIGYLPDPMKPKDSMHYFKELVNAVPQLKTIIFNPGPNFFGMKISGLIEIWDLLMVSTDNNRI